jgi:hypothetical protein
VVIGRHVDLDMSRVWPTMLQKVTVQRSQHQFHQIGILKNLWDALHITDHPQ